MSDDKDSYEKDEVNKNDEETLNDVDEKSE